MNLKNTWKAKWESGVLHIQGMSDEFPNDFSTSSLQRLKVSEDGITAFYQIVFHKDKEPFCGQDLVGPVHHWERGLPIAVQRIAIRGKDADWADVSVPERV